VKKHPEVARKGYDELLPHSVDQAYPTTPKSHYGAAVTQAHHGYPTTTPKSHYPPQQQSYQQPQNQYQSQAQHQSYPQQQDQNQHAIGY
jgi:hypothetical protein